MNYLTKLKGRIFPSLRPSILLSLTLCLSVFMFSSIFHLNLKHHWNHHHDPADVHADGDELLYLSQYQYFLKGMASMLAVQHELDWALFQTHFEQQAIAFKLKEARAFGFIRFVPDSKPKTGAARDKLERGETALVEGLHAPIQMLDGHEERRAQMLGTDMFAPALRYQNSLLKAALYGRAVLGPELHGVGRLHGIAEDGEQLLLLPVYKMTDNANLHWRDKLAGWVFVLLKPDSTLAHLMLGGNMPEAELMRAADARADSMRDQAIRWIDSVWGHWHNEYWFIFVAATMSILLVAAMLRVVPRTQPAVAESMHLANLVYQHSSEGMVVTDQYGNVIHTNPAFTAITGYSAEEVKGKNPRYWSSGRHSKDFYGQMWQSLLKTGSWQGEIWNRRKNGEIFAEWLSLNAIHDEEGKLHGFVSLYSDLTEKKKAAEMLWRQTNFDSLTNCPNRQMMQDQLRIELAKAKAGSRGLSFLLIDVDNFKYINDSLGHHVGDSMLCILAKRILAGLYEGDVLARFGGDEFAVILLPHPGGEADVVRVENILHRIGEEMEVEGVHIYVTASFGVSNFPCDGEDEATLIKNADQALFKAKEMGRNCFCYYTHQMQQNNLERMQLGNDLRHALAREELEVWLQPIVDLKTGQIFKAEALLRWHHPRLGMVSPARFIPLAEEIGMISKIGNWVFQESVRYALRLSEISGKPFQISVNRSPLQFHHNFDCETWFACLRQHGLPMNAVAIEITEGVMMQGEHHVHQQLGQFAAAGMPISMDDFGTGYSSLHYLRKFHVDYLKIDQSFVRDMLDNDNSRAIVETIILMGHKMGICLIAEGVETEAQAQMLKELGCDLGQGYFFAKPMPVADMEQYLRDKYIDSRAHAVLLGFDKRSSQTELS